MLSDLSMHEHALKYDGLGSYNKESELKKMDLPTTGALSVGEMADEIKKDAELTGVIEHDIRAGYKIQVLFGKDRTTAGPNYALVTCWVSGKYLNGEGDEAMYFCLDAAKIKDANSYKMYLSILRNKEGTDYRAGCGGLIPSTYFDGKTLYCPSCKTRRNAERCTNMLPFHGSPDELVELTEYIFSLLGRNADIYCKYHHTDIRYKAMEGKYGLETARKLRGMFIYPLKNIIKDTGNGSALSTKLRQFYSA